VEAEAHLLALGIAAIAPVLDPEAVILGGGVGRSGDLLADRIERELHALSPFRPRILVSELGDEAVLAGAVATSLDEARREIFDRPAGPVRNGRTPGATSLVRAVPTGHPARASHGGGSR
jgi:predicted NBD/HSP70 family sugar kinase